MVEFYRIIMLLQTKTSSGTESAAPEDRFLYILYYILTHFWIIFNSFSKKSRKNSQKNHKIFVRINDNGKKT